MTEYTSSYELQGVTLNDNDILVFSIPSDLNHIDGYRVTIKLFFWETTDYCYLRSTNDYNAYIFKILGFSVEQMNEFCIKEYEKYGSFNGSNGYPMFPEGTSQGIHAVCMKLFEWIDRNSDSTKEIIIDDDGNIL